MTDIEKIPKESIIANLTDYQIRTIELKYHIKELRKLNDRKGKLVKDALIELSEELNVSEGTIKKYYSMYK